MTEGRDLRGTLRFFALALVGVSVVALAAGWLYGRLNPDSASARLIGDLVIVEPEGAAPGDPAAPTSGNELAEAGCGVRSAPIPVPTQLGSLEAGVVVVQYQPDAIGPTEQDRVTALSEDGLGVLVGPNPDLAAPVVATAWTRRMPLRAPSAELLRAFVSLHGEPDPCPA